MKIHSRAVIAQNSLSCMKTVKKSALFREKKSHFMKMYTLNIISLDASLSVCLCVPVRYNCEPFEMPWAQGTMY